MSEPPLTVGIAEDSLLLREGLSRILSDAGMELVASYDNADDLLACIRSRPLDIAILDIRLPPSHTDEGMRAALHIRQHHPEVAVLVLSQYVEVGLALQLLAGLRRTRRLPAEGPDQRCFGLHRRRTPGRPRRVRDRPDDRLCPGQEAANDDPLARLTPRERQVLELMASGTSNQGIADKLVITLRAAEKYVSSIFAKLGIPSTRNESRRVLAVLLYLRS